jgi:hypothetical protein
VSRKLELNQVHVMEKVGTAQWAVTKTRPALRLCKGENTLFIQQGTVFTPGGDPLPAKDVPAWFLEEVQKASPAALLECGYQAPKLPRKVAAAQATV